MKTDQMKRMLRKVCAVVSTMLLVPFAAQAANYYWTGEGADTLWTTPANWNPSTGYPGTDDAANFHVQNGNATVTLPSGTTKVNYIFLNNGMQVTINAADGATDSKLMPTRDNEGFIVYTDEAKLTVNVPVVQETSPVLSRGSGTLVLNAGVSNPWNTGNIWLTGARFQEGTVVLDGQSALSVPSTTLVVGQDYADDDTHPMTFEIREGCSVTAANLTVNQSNRTVSNDVTVRQKGADSQVTVVNNTIVGRYGSEESMNTYELEEGTFASEVLYIGYPNGNGRKSSPAQFVQKGGVAKIQGIYCAASPSHEGYHYYLEGGELVMNKTPWNVEDGIIRITGGELHAKMTVVTDTRFTTDEGDLVFNVDAGRVLVLNKLPKPAAGCAIVKKGAGILRLNESGEPPPVKILEGTVETGPDVVLYRETEGDWKVELGDKETGTAGVLDLNYRGAMITAPLDLTYNTSACRVKIYDAPHYFTSVVAHRIAVWDATQETYVESEPKRYTAQVTKTFNGVQLIDANNGCGILLPHVWTGTGDGVSWNDANNWKEKSVPTHPMHDDGVDLSAAAGKTVNFNPSNPESYCVLAYIVFNPPRQAAQKTVTLSGTKAFNLAPITPSQLWSTAFFVSRGNELVMDVDVYSGYKQPQAAIGGGRLVAQKFFMGYVDVGGGTGKVTPYIGDLDFVFRGAKANFFAPIVFGGDFLGGASSGYADKSAGRYSPKLFFETGVKLSLGTMLLGEGGTYPAGSRGVEQTGGAVTADAIVMEKFDNDCVDTWPFEYVLKDGTLTVADGIYLGSKASTVVDLAAVVGVADWTKTRFPGGSFVMKGGTLTAAKLASEGNQNWFKLYGGEVYLGAGGFAVTDTAAGRNTTAYGSGMNAEKAWLGGVTIHATAASASAAKVRFTGAGGDTTVDTAGFNLSFAAVEGAGGLVKAGSGVLTLTDATGFTGKVIVRGGSVAFGSDASVGMISLTSANDLTVAAGLTVTAQRLVIDGVAQTGTIPFGDGFVTVASANFWQGADGSTWTTGWSAGAPSGAAAVADFSTSITLGSSDTITLDAATTLKTLTFDNKPTVTDLTLAGGATLTLADGGEIFVAKGKTLTLDVPVALGGAVCKTGDGKLVLAKTVTGTALTVVGGDMEISGVMTGVDLTVAPYENASCAIVQTGTLDLGGLASWTLTESADASYAIDGGTLKLPAALDWGKAAVSLTDTTLVLADGASFALDETFAAMLSDATLEIGSTSTVTLDYAGVAAIKAVMHGTRPVVKGTYKAGDLKGHILGSGQLEVLTGEPLGVMIIVR